MGIRRDLVPWLQIMTELGVSHFYVNPDRLPHPPHLTLCIHDIARSDSLRL